MEEDASGGYVSIEDLALFRDLENLCHESARETRFWLRRARRPGLLPQQTADGCIARLESIMRRFSALVATRRRRLSQVRERPAPYIPFTESRDHESPNHPEGKRCSNAKNRSGY